MAGAGSTVFYICKGKSQPLTHVKPNEPGKSLSPRSRNDPGAAPVSFGYALILKLLPNVFN